MVDLGNITISVLSVLKLITVLWLCKRDTPVLCKVKLIKQGSHYTEGVCLHKQTKT